MHVLCNALSSVSYDGGLFYRPIQSTIHMKYDNSIFLTIYELTVFSLDCVYSNRQLLMITRSHQKIPDFTNSSEDIGLLSKL